MEDLRKNTAFSLSPQNLPMLRRFKEALLSAAGESWQDGILVGFSGGGDSCALLALLCTLRDLPGEGPEGKFLPGKDLPGKSLRLHAVHVHHGLRGKEADEDEAFCREFCFARQIGFTAVRGDVRSLAAKWHTGIEAAGRRFRYESFARIRRELGFGCIATAHQGDDQAETLLLHLLRGCGTEGLRGIAEKTLLSDGALLLRPLLSFSSEELRRFCAAEKIPFREDGSNQDTTFTRNALRQKVLPLLKEMNPGFLSSAAHLSSLAAADSEFFSAQTEEAMTLSEEAQRTLPDALLSRVLQRRFREAVSLYGDRDPAGLQTLFSPPNPLPYESLTRLMTLFRRGEPFKLSLPGGMTAWQQDRRLLFCPGGDPRRKQPRGTLCAPFGAPLPLFLGENPLPGFPARLFLSPAEREGDLSYAGSLRDWDQKHEKCEKIYRILIKIPLPSVTIKRAEQAPLPLVCRAPHSGDRFFTGGRKRPVGELLRAIGVPQPLRSCYPLLCDDDGILWIPGYPPREGLCGRIFEKKDPPADGWLCAELRFFEKDGRNS